jgi:hypothetical protein
MKKLLLAVLVAGLLGLAAGNAMAATSTDSANIDLLVTPVVIVDLNVTPTYYNFGNIDLQTSTMSLTALTLSNAGNVGFKIEKAVWANGADWDITKSSTQTNGFDLWAMVNASKPTLLSEFAAASAGFNEAGTGSDTYMNALKDSGGVQVNMSPTQTQNMWFRLDMPKYVTKEAQQTIKVRLKATAN